jgi:hypothetical protein
MTGTGPAMTENAMEISDDALLPLWAQRRPISGAIYCFQKIVTFSF